MKSDVESVPLEFTCAACHHEWPALAGILFDHRSIACPVCGAEREVDVTELEKTIGAEVNAYFHDNAASP